MIKTLGLNAEDILSLEKSRSHGVVAQVFLRNEGARVLDSDFEGGDGRGRYKHLIFIPVIDGEVIGR